MTDMSAEFYRCCGYTVEITGYQVEMPDGQKGHRVNCELCGRDFVAPGDVQAARDAAPAHFLAVHRLHGSLESWSP